MSRKTLHLAWIIALVLISPLQAQPRLGAPIDTPTRGSYLGDPIPVDDDSNWQINGGASFYLLQPFYQNNVAFGVTTSTTNAAGNVANGMSQSREFDWKMQPAMEVWLGVTTPIGLGFRTRYFHMDAASGNPTVGVSSPQYNAANSPVIAVSPSPFLFNSPPGTVPQQNAGQVGLFGGPSPFIVNFPGAPASVDRFQFHSDLRIDAVDMEFTGEWKSPTLSLVGGVGGRYFHMTQNYTGTLSNENSAGATLTESLQSNRTFQGGGPTISGQMSWHPFLPNLSLFAGGRASLAVGRTSQVTTGSQIINDPNGAFNPIGAPTMTSNSFRIPYSGADTMPIAELELGMEYAIYLRRHQIFFRGAVVDQTYFGAGNASRSDGNLSLLGFQITVGINY